MRMEGDGRMSNIGTAADPEARRLTSAEALMRGVLLFGFVAVLLTEAYLLWRAWEQLF